MHAWCSRQVVIDGSRGVRTEAHILAVDHVVGSECRSFAVEAKAGLAQRRISPCKIHFAAFLCKIARLGIQYTVGSDATRTCNSDTVVGAPVASVRRRLF